MSIVERVKNICLTPKSEWPVIAREPTSTGSLLSGYVVPLVAIGAVAGFIGGSIVGQTLPFIGWYRVPVVAGVGVAIFSFVMAIVGVFLLSLIINALAPTFGGEKSNDQALKVAVYSYTPAWVAGVLQILPMGGTLFGLLAALYALYLLYLGLPRLMKCPPDKAIGYTAVVVICAIVMTFVIAGIGATITGAGMIGAGALSGMAGSTPSSSDVRFDKDSPMGKLQEFGKKLEESGKKMEAAEKSGDAHAQAAAAMESLGTLFGGGRRVEPLEIDALKPFVPDTFAGLPKTSSSAEKNGMAGLMVSKAEGRYGDGGKNATLEVSDTGGVSGLVGLAGWISVQGEKEDESGSERTRKVDGRITHEKRSKVGGTNEFAIVLGDRFVVSAKSNSVDLPALKAAVTSLDLGKLEGMKDVGVQK